MAEDFVIADCHFGHAGVEKYRRGFGIHDSKSNDEVIMSNIISTCTNHDRLWMLGDCFIDLESLSILRILKLCLKEIHIVLGNHDTEGNRYSKVLLPAINEGLFDSVHGVHKRKEYWMTHTPMHPLELHGKLNIHGHVHNYTIPDDRYVNVSVDNTGMKPIPIKDILDGWRGNAKNYAY